MHTKIHNNFLQCCRLINTVSSLVHLYLRYQSPLEGTSWNTHTQTHTCVEIFTTCAEAAGHDFRGPKLFSGKVTALCSFFNFFYEKQTAKWSLHGQVVTWCFERKNRRQPKGRADDHILVNSAHLRLRSVSRSVGILPARFRFSRVNSQ